MSKKQITKSRLLELRDSGYNREKMAEILSNELEANVSPNVITDAAKAFNINLRKKGEQFSFIDDIEVDDGENDIRLVKGAMEPHNPIVEQMEEVEEGGEGEELDF